MQKENEALSVAGNWLIAYCEEPRGDGCHICPAVQILNVLLVFV